MSYKLKSSHLFYSLLVLTAVLTMLYLSRPQPVAPALVTKPSDVIVNTGNICDQYPNDVTIRTTCAPLPNAGRSK
jgi:hypothetical protein